MGILLNLFDPGPSVCDNFREKAMRLSRKTGGFGAMLLDACTSRLCQSQPPAEVPLLNLHHAVDNYDTNQGPYIVFVQRLSKILERFLHF